MTAQSASWRLRYAAHLGFRSPELPLFPASAGSVDPLAQITFAASLGFAGVQDPWFATRPPSVREAIAAAIARHGLSAGCIVCGSAADVRTPLWTQPGVDGRGRLAEALECAMAGALQIGARHIAVLTGAQEGAPREAQIEALIANLRWAASRAEANGLTLCLEPTNSRTLPGMLLNRFDEGCAIVRAADSPAVRMIFDTAHIQCMDGDLLGRFERERGLIALVQIANHPGRTEPEIGEINMATILRAVRASGYDGLVELEHLWATPGKPAERRELEWLEALDASL